jgi:hypothetical protein
MSINTAEVTTGGNTVYTSSGSTAITWLSLCNYGASSANVSVYVVPSGDTAANSNLILTQIELLAASANGTGDTYQIYSAGEKLLLDTGDFVYATSSANTVTAVVSYTSI